MKKNIFDKIQDLFAAKIEAFENREDKEVLKTLLFWMVFFFPYGLYLLLFKTKTNKFLKIIITVSMIFFTIIGLDVALYPNRVYDKVAKEEYAAFVLEHEDLKLREPLYVSKVSTFNLNNEIYFGFNIFDNIDMYYGIFKIKDFHKNYELVSLYSIDHAFSNIYALSTFQNVKDIHPVILSFILSNEKDINMDMFSSVEKIKEADIFNDVMYQDLKINDKTYSFTFNDFSVIKIIDKQDKTVLFEDSSEYLFDDFMPRIVKNILNKNFGKNYNIVGYNYCNNSHFYNVEVGTEYYTVKYVPGIDADLLLIENLDEFKKHFLNMILK